MRNVLLFGLLLVLLAGCATKKIQSVGPVFFPPDPNPPRIQFLLGIGDSRDVEGKQTEFSLVSLNTTQSDEVKGFIKPYGVTTHGDKIYVSDTLAGKVAVIDLRKKRFDWLKGDFGPGKLKKPINMTTDKAGNLYVVDSVRKKVVVFDSEGNFTKVYGEAYDMKPVDVAVDDKRLYVLDLSRSKILVFDKQKGELLEGLGQDAENPADRLSMPTNMTLTDQGIFYVSNITSGKVIKLDRDGHVLATVGKMGDGFGQFGRPKGVATDSTGQVYVVDTAHQNVQVFAPEGRLLMFFGDPGLPEGSLNLPAAIDATNESLDLYQSLAAPGFELEQVILVTNQVGKHKIGIYGLGKKQGFDYEKFYRESEDMARKADASKADRNQPRDSK